MREPSKWYTALRKAADAKTALVLRDQRRRGFFEVLVK